MIFLYLFFFLSDIGFSFFIELLLLFIEFFPSSDKTVSSLLINNICLYGGFIFIVESPNILGMGDKSPLSGHFDISSK